MRPTTTFDDLIHAPYRLRICAMLAATNAVEFGTLRDALGVSDSVLSKHLTPLNAAGYIQTARGTGSARRRLWVSLTPEGRSAFAAHVRALQSILSTDGSPDAVRPDERLLRAPVRRRP
jgi:DNA-binding MarR family transcriptional regulator